MECEYKTNRYKKTCDSFFSGGLCGRKDMFRCIEYIERFEPRLSHSGITNFLRCPLNYYYSNVKGLQVREELLSDPIKIGNAVDDYVTNILLGGKRTKKTIFLDGDITCMWEAKAVAIIKAFKRLINTDKVRELYTGQKEFLIQNDGQPHVKGFIDLHAKDGKKFIELKTGKNPSYYLNLFYIRPKLAAYFMSLDTYETGTIWAIRVPDLKRMKQFKNESFPDHAARCERVMMAEPTHYFPGYNGKTRNFGVRFGRAEIDLKSTVADYRIIADYIKLAAKKNVWVQNGAGCLHPFKCDYFVVCENNGRVSEDIFDFRKKEETESEVPEDGV